MYINKIKIKSDISFENEMYEKIKRKINFIKDLGISFEELSNKEQIKYNYLKHVIKSINKCDCIYEIDNNISNIFTSKLDVIEDNIYILEAVSLIMKYVSELLPCNDKFSKLHFEDVLSKEDKTNLEENIIKLAFYLLIPFDKLSIEEENLIRKYSLNNEDITWYRSMFIFNLSKKYNLPESVIDKKLKLIAQTNNYDLTINNFLLGKRNVLYKDDANNQVDKKSIVPNIIK